MYIISFCVYVNKGICVYNFTKYFCSKLLLEFKVLHWFISVQSIWLEYMRGSEVYFINMHHSINPTNERTSKQLRFGSWNWNISRKSGNPMWLQNLWAMIGPITFPVEMNSSAEYAPNIVVYINWNTRMIIIIKWSILEQNIFIININY